MKDWLCWEADDRIERAKTFHEYHEEAAAEAFAEYVYDGSGEHFDNIEVYVREANDPNARIYRIKVGVNFSPTFDVESSDIAG